MGNKYTVLDWRRRKGMPPIDYGTAQPGYHNVEVYRGESLLRALAAMVRAKRAGSGCVRLEWRG